MYEYNQSAAPKRTIDGSALISVNDKRCKVTVKNVRYVAVERLNAENPKVEIPKIETLKNRTTKELGIHELKMEDIKTNMEIDRVQLWTTIHMATTYTLVRILTLSVICIACLLNGSPTTCQQQRQRIMY